jgi:hypothetical protein
MPKQKENPRYYPKKEKNPIYNTWDRASRGGVIQNFSVPTNKIPVQFNWQDVMPYENVGPYSTDNYKLAANYVPKIMERWPNMNFNDAVGLAANFLYESGGNAQLREHGKPHIITPVDPAKMTGSGGFGLAQLTGPRKKAFWDYVGKDSKRAADPMEQLAYMKAESEGLIPGMEYEEKMYAKARGAKNPAQGAYNVVKYVERPDTAESWPVRMATADSVAKYAKAMPKKPKPTPKPATMMSSLGQFGSDAWNQITSMFD